MVVAMCYIFILCYTLNISTVCQPCLFVVGSHATADCSQKKSNNTPGTFEWVVAADYGEWELGTCVGEFYCI